MEWIPGAAAQTCGTAFTARLAVCAGDLVVPAGVISDRFVGSAFAREHRMLGLDVLVRAGCRRDLDELGEQLPAEQPVVLQSLIAAFELGYVGARVFPPVPSDGTGRRSRHASRSDQRSGTH